MAAFNFNPSLFDKGILVPVADEREGLSVKIDEAFNPMETN